MSFLQFCRILWARRWIVIAATAGCFLAALLTIQLLPTRYEAKSRVMLELLKPDPVTGQVIASNFARTYMSTQAELIRDDRVTGAVVDSLGWTNSPQLLASYNAAVPDRSMDFRRWLGQIISANTKVTPVEGSNILEITYTGNDPQSAAAVADAVRAAYVDQSVAFKRESAGGTANWFDTQLVKLRGQLTAAEARKTAFEKANNVVIQDDNTDTESNRLKALATSATAGPLVTPAAALPPSPNAAALAQLDARIVSESQALGPNHPTIQDMKRQRTALAQTVAQERTAAPTINTGPSIAGQVAAQTNKVISQRNKVEEARRLGADVAVVRDQYVKTAARAADLRQQAESNDSGLTLLGSAVTPERPSFPNVPLILIGSFLFGLALGVLSAVITEMLSRRVRGVEDLASTGAPVIVVVGAQVDTTRASRPSLMQRLRLRGPEVA
ncbi:Wzz/FepE/Etk N-terminal domain-containing protein [Sphingomonas sp. Leaf343]|uniref:Wzz/FepE/Etk N-terminal domain-containing protein n=1 Tax=Sphingomonas sp. Leaf343 TaxID=1736345 RepID=UPI0006FC7895|nr:Wzz/FepE/Etk N-terminal domain-containing protein [Sphingomonas sp. Leaf343]KQR88061.1 hypothetical protein ASG07_04255 [Sphingomonas sp. Leaf343]